MFLILERVNDTAGGAPPYVYTASRKTVHEAVDLVTELSEAEQFIPGWKRNFIITQLVA